MTRAVIIATGPSLTPDDVIDSFTLNRRTYVVNDAYLLAPWADVLYACDEQWWSHHEPHTRGFCRWTTTDAAAQKYGLNHIPGRGVETSGVHFDTSGHGIIYGSNSGFQALNLAYAQGVRDVVLLGFDMGHDPGQPKHFFGSHPSHMDNPTPFGHCIKQFERAAPIIAAAGMKVVNATRRTRLTCFPRVALSECD